MGNTQGVEQGRPLPLHTDGQATPPPAQHQPQSTVSALPANMEQPEQRYEMVGITLLPSSQRPAH